MVNGAGLEFGVASAKGPGLSPPYHIYFFLCIFSVSQTVVPLMIILKSNVIIREGVKIMQQVMRDAIKLPKKKTPGMLQAME